MTIDDTRPDEEQDRAEPGAVQAFTARIPDAVWDRIAELKEQAVEAAEDVRHIVYDYDRLSATVDVLSRDLHDGNGILTFHKACGLEQVWLVVAAAVGPLNQFWEGCSDEVVAKGKDIIRDVVRESRGEAPTDYDAELAELRARIATLTTAMEGAAAVLDVKRWPGTN